MVLNLSKLSVCNLGNLFQKQPSNIEKNSFAALMVEPIFDYQFRLILIGDSTVGKSSLLKYFTDGKFFDVSGVKQGSFKQNFYSKSNQLKAGYNLVRRISEL